MTIDEMAAIHAAAFDRGRPWGAVELRELLRTPDTFCVEAGSVETGRCFAIGRIAAGEAELLTLATAPAARRRGLARACLAAFLAEAAARGAAEAFLEVAADNAPALALYRAAGFRDVGRRERYYRRAGSAPADAIVMRCAPA